MANRSRRAGQRRGGGLPRSRSFRDLSQALGQGSGGCERSAAAESEDSEIISPASPVSDDGSVSPPPPPTRGPPSRPSPPPTSTTSSTGLELENVHRFGQMGETNAFFLGHHHEQMVAVMKQKYTTIMDYEKTHNRGIQHLDWVAGNPSDPVNRTGVGSETAATDGLSDEDRALRASVAAVVMKYVHEVDNVDPKEHWNKTMFFGDWVTNASGERQFFVEIQLKRIPGDDDELLEKCGIHSTFAWLSLHDEDAKAVQPLTVPFVYQMAVPTQLALQSEIPLLLAAGDLVSRNHTSPVPNIDAIAEEQAAEPAPGRTSSLQVPMSSADKGKGKAVADDKDDKNNNLSPPPSLKELDRPEIAPASAFSQLSVGQPSRQPRRPLNPNVVNDLVNPPIPRYDDDETSVSASTDTAGDPSSAPPTPPLHATVPTITFTPADTGVPDPAFEAHRKEVDRQVVLKAQELTRVFHFALDRDFQARKKKSFVYAVRVVAFPDKPGGTVNNVFTGPRAADRHGTLLGMGGWVVPPLEERVARREQHQRAYRNKGARPGKYEGLPKPQANWAVPIKFDWSGRWPQRYFGQPAPVWKEVTDPCLEDAYWMVWQLLSGRTFLGFKPGTGFGMVRMNVEGDRALLDQCPFKSPSPEAIYHAASWPRGDERKNK
ncbi:hypothetical protein VTK56DRAFT_2890 [Thermocarpiscus australiensis]